MPDYTNPLKPSGKKTKTWNFNEKQLKAMTREATMEGVKAGVYIGNAALTVAYLTTLRDMDGFAQKRLHDRFAHAQKLFEEILEKRIQYQDLAQALMDECGVDLVIEKPEGVSQSVIDLFEEIEKPERMVMRIRKE